MKKKGTALKDYLGQPGNKYDQSIITWMLGLMEKYGSIEYAIKSAKNLAGAALNEYYRVFGAIPDSIDKQCLEDIVMYMIKRDY